MERQLHEIPALLIIDMVKDSLGERSRSPIAPLAKRIINPINEIISNFREQKWPIVFATDAFQEGDFFFKGGMKPYSIDGTTGAEVIDELDRQENDLWLKKRKLSAFLGTNLNEWLKQQSVNLCAVAGITTNFCVLSTVMDAISYDYKTVILEDCTMARTIEQHNQILDVYRNNSMLPLLNVMDSTQFISTMLKGSK